MGITNAEFGAHFEPLIKLQKISCEKIYQRLQLFQWIFNPHQILRFLKTILNFCKL